MKAYREAADKAMSAKLKRLGAKGDTDKKCYADGGRVGFAFGGAPSQDMGGDLGGDAPKPNLGKKSFGSAQKAKKGGKGGGKTVINIINMKDGAPGGAPGLPPGGPPLPPGGPGGPPMMPPKPPMLAGPPGGGLPPGGPPMPPGGPMIRKSGGRVVARASGGRVGSYKGLKMEGGSSPVGKRKG